MDTREQIISDSLRLFNNQGEERAGVREIARSLGISPGNLSYHFPRKEDIIRLHLDRLNHELEILIQVYLQEEEDLYRFPELIKSCMERQYQYRGLFHSSSGLVLELLTGQVTSSITKLSRHGQLQLSEEDILFLTGVINFQLKFWLAGIELSSEVSLREKLVRGHIATIVKLLMLFASPNGRINLLKFKAGLLRPV